MTDGVAVISAGATIGVSVVTVEIVMDDLCLHVQHDLTAVVF